jgi:hypothetical protein
MTELMVLLIGASLPTLIGYLYWERRRRPGRQEGGAVCVWCLYRRGDLCMHPGSPVYPGECSPVCVGDRQCDVRHLRARR